MLFGINQGCTFDDLRVRHMQKIAELDLDGYAIGGLAVGESAEEMYRVIDSVEPYMPKDKIRYLIVSTCIDEVCEYVVCIGSTDKLVYGNTHLLSIVSSKNITEVTCRNNDVYLFAVLDFAVLDKACISGDIVNNLR